MCRLMNDLVSMRHCVLWDVRCKQAYQRVYVSEGADLVGAMKQE